MTDALGRQIVVENRAGANGVVGTEVAARSAPDGYTLLFIANGHANGVLAPAGTPPPIVGRLNALIVQIIRSPEVADRIRGLGANPATSTPEESGAYIAAEIAKWGRIIKAAGVRLD